MKFPRRIARMLMQAKRFGLTPDRINESKDGISAYWFSPDKLEGGASRRYVWLSADADGVSFLLSNRDGDNGPAYSVRDWSRQRKQILTSIREWLFPQSA